MKTMSNSSTDSIIKWYETQFQAQEKSVLNGNGLGDLRASAMKNFSERGFPTTRDEEWRFTNVAPITKAMFNVAPGSRQSVSDETVQPHFFGGLQCHRLVFVNGSFVVELSSIPNLSKGAFITNLQDALKQGHAIAQEHLGKYASFTDNAFTSLNTAFLQDGLFVHVSDGVSVDVPVHAIYLSTGTTDAFVSYPRNLIVVGRNGRLSLVESYVHATNVSYLTNAVTEVVLSEDAVVEHDKLQDEAATAYHISATHVHQSTRSTYTSNAVSIGGAIVRNNITTVLNAERCECTLNGLSLGTGTQLVDNHTAIDHAKPNCASHELYKAVLDGKARGVFNGKIFVRKDAQKTDAKQTNKTVLLSDDAGMDTKPQLEIFADDVKCTHGATVGQLDDEQVFYLRSRGLGINEARDILTFAFASDVISRVHIEPLREQLDMKIRDRLQKGRMSA